MLKPEFWTDERLTECSVSARLLAIASLNFADDAGNLERSARRLKMQAFPADTIDVEPLIGELISANWFVEYEVDGSKYLNIKNFLKHQFINRPSRSTIPPPRNSVSPHGALTEDSQSPPPELNRIELNRKEKKRTKAKAQDPAPPSAPLGDLVPPEWVDRGAWAAFLAMRRTIRKPATRRPQELVVRELEKLQAQGNDPTAVLEQSVRNGWQDVFPLRDKSPKGQDMTDEQREAAFVAKAEARLRAKGGADKIPGGGDAGC
jgi:hypothetical protein